MALPNNGAGGVWRRYAPHALMTLVQLCYTILYFITEAAFNRGLNPYVYVTYRHLLVGVLLWPSCAKKPEMKSETWCLTLNMYFTSLKYTSPTFVTSTGNAVPSITFFMAIILRSYPALVSSMKRYPAELSLTAWISLVGGIQSAVFAVIMQHKQEDWLIGFGLKFWCIVYTGIACNGFTIFIQLYCTKKKGPVIRKGPVFVTMFNPLLTVMVAILAYLIFGENLYFGSIIGGALAILGLYMLLWGKDKDQEQEASKEQEPELDHEKQEKVDDISSG
uniref:WAT1-related protein n=1 Tax=Setaria italica TaxID=4555 RepID=K4AIX6_SETIT